MPQRFLRTGITNSERWNAAPFPDQSLFIRLLTLVDDYGRFDGRVSVIHGQCFAVWNEQNPADAITPERCEQMLARLVAAGLISWYEVSGKRIVQIEQWRERVRSGVKEKWPANPETCSKLQQPAASCRNLRPPSPPPPPSPDNTTVHPSAVTTKPNGNAGKDLKRDAGLDGVINGIAQAHRVSPFDRPTLQDVERFLSRQFPGAKNYASPFFNAMESQSWCDKSGKLVQDWRKMAKDYASKAERNKRAQRQS